MKSFNRELREKIPEHGRWIFGVFPSEKCKKTIYRVYAMFGGTWFWAGDSKANRSQVTEMEQLIGATLPTPLATAAHVVQGN
jgi:hypothetical protein